MQKPPSPPAPGTPGRVPVALYNAGADDATKNVGLVRSRRYASDREWVVVSELADNDTSVPLDARSGWTTATVALSDGSARGIVVGNRAMVAIGDDEFEALRVVVGGFGAFLVEALGRPNRSAGQRRRRRFIYDVAAGGPEVAP